LHDIGKVGIPDNVLLKPGRLTVDEFEIMKQHAVMGSQTLDAALCAQPSAEYLRFARDIAWTHHEKYDGSGYPRGLAGDDIPLCGRIVAVADVYDALTTKRIYKDAFSHEKARAIITDGRGKDFDPDIVDAFLSCENKFIAIKQQLDATVHPLLSTVPIGDAPVASSFQMS
jgi:putative two-component system response regulator